jgi:hypothetical protein
MHDDDLTPENQLSSQLGAVVAALIWLPDACSTPCINASAPPGWVGSNKGTQSCIAFWKTLSYQEVTKFLGLQHLHKMCRK